MFRTMRNLSKDGTLVGRAVEAIRRRLPPGWTAEKRKKLTTPILRLSGPDTRRVDLLIIGRKEIRPRDVSSLLAAMDGLVLAVAPYLSARTRELLAQGGASYADATGNLRVVVASPAIFLEGVGAEQPPERAPRPLHSLRGGAAGRVVRSLVELQLPLGVRALAAAAATPLGTVSRVVTFLETEALLTRDDKKRILTVAWPDLLSRWAKNYELTKSNDLHTFLEPRGLPSLWVKPKAPPSLRRDGVAGGRGRRADAPRNAFCRRPRRRRIPTPPRAGRRRRKRLAAPPLRRRRLHTHEGAVVACRRGDCRHRHSVRSAGGRRPHVEPRARPSRGRSTGPKDEGGKA